MEHSRRAGTGAAAWLPLLLACHCSCAHALFGDRLQLRLSEQITTDSNVFRLSSGRDPVPAIGATDKADVLRTLRMGMSLELPVSRQRVQIAYTRTSVTYNRFVSRNFDGHDQRATWLWQLGNDWHGQVGYSESLALASTGIFQTSVPNPLRIRQTFGSATYQLTARWQLQAGLASNRQENADPARQVNDFESFTPDVSISYVTPAQTTLGVALRVEDGRFPNRQFVAGSFIDNAYLQRTVGPFFDWQISGHSHVSARYDRITRNYSQISARDFEGSGYRLGYDWNPSGKFSLSANFRREVSPVQDIRTSFVLAHGYSLRPALILAPKLTAAATLDYVTSDYLGDPGLVFGTAAPRSDTQKTIGLSLSYVPTRNLTFQLNGTHETRSSSLPLNDYSANVLSVSGQFAF